MASGMSEQLLGVHIDGIWHSGIVVHGREYFFGGGIFYDAPGGTQYGVPNKKLSLGETSKTLAEFEAFLDSIRPRFRMQDYNLLSHNCNNFTDECSKFLVGKGIPQDIIDLPNRALATPIGAMLRPQIEMYQQQMVSQYSGIDASIPQPPAHPHHALKVPLFTLGKPIAHASGAMNKAVERLQQLNAEVVTEAIQTLSLAKDASQFKMYPEDRLPPLVEYLIKALHALPVEQQYPVIDMLRVVCLHPKGLTLLHEHAERPFVFQCIFDASAFKLSYIAANRFLQNLLIVPGSLVKSPLDVATAKFVATALASPEAKVSGAAAYAAYNFALALKTLQEDEAMVIFVSALAGFLKEAPVAQSNTFEFLSVLLALGTALYGHTTLVGTFRKLCKRDLNEFRGEGANQQLCQTIDQLNQILNL